MSRSLLPAFLLALILHGLLARVELDLFKRPVPGKVLPRILTIDIVRPQPANRPPTVKRPSIVVKKPALKKQIERDVKPKPRVSTPTLPSPFKGQGLGGGEKWDFLYTPVRQKTEVRERIQPRLPQRGLSGQAEKPLAKKKPPEKDETLARLSPVELPGIKKGEIDSPSHAPIMHAIPVYRKNTPPQYPLIARRRGYEGSVLLEVLVKKDGRAGSIRLARSSGYEVLDRAAIKGVRTWLFHPAKRGDESVEMWVEIPIRFQLK